MPDFRVDDTAPEHPKMRAAGIAAVGLWTMAGAWSSSPTQMTDGWIPGYWVQTWPGGKKAAETLVQVGLWRKADRNGMPGYQFHDWDDYQRTAAAWEDEKRKARERMKNIRSGHVRPNKPRTSVRTGPERAANVHDSLTLTHTSSDELVTPPSGAPRPKRGTRLPDDFAVTDEMIAWAREKTPLVGRAETDAFRDHWGAETGRGAVKLDWVAAWRNWMRRAQKDAERRLPRTSNGHKPNADDTIADLLRVPTTLTLLEGGQA